MTSITTLTISILLSQLDYFAFNNNKLQGTHIFIASKRAERWCFHRCLSVIMFTIHWDMDTPPPSDLPRYWHQVVITGYLFKRSYFRIYPHQYWHLVMATEPRTVCKRVVCILLECYPDKRISTGDNFVDFDVTQVLWRYVWLVTVSEETSVRRVVLQTDTHLFTCVILCCYTSF